MGQPSVFPQAFIPTNVLIRANLGEFFKTTKNNLLLLLPLYAKDNSLKNKVM